MMKILFHGNLTPESIIQKRDFGVGGLQVFDFHKECNFPLYEISLSKIVLI